MDADHGAPVRRRAGAMVWVGRVLSALPVLMMGGIGTMMLFNPGEAVKGMKQFGFPEEVVYPMLIVEVLCALIYAIPQTAVLGAILLTGYLGGAVATHVRAGDYGHCWIPAVVGGVVWLGIYLREPGLRRLVFWRHV